MSGPVRFSDTILGNLLYPDPNRPYCGDTFFHGGPHRCVLKPGHPEAEPHDCGESCTTCLRNSRIARDMGKNGE